MRRGRIEQRSGTIVHGASANKYSEPVHSDGRMDSLNPVFGLRTATEQANNYLALEVPLASHDQPWSRSESIGGNPVSDACLTCFSRLPLEPRCAAGA